MSNFFKKILLMLNKAVKSRWFLIAVIFCVILLLIWVVIPGISIFGLSILKSSATKVLTTFFVLIIVLGVWLYKKNLLSFSKVVAFFVERNEKKSKKLNLTDVKVREELKSLVSLLKKRKKINKKDTPIYAILGENKESLESILRHSSKKSNATNDSISVDKFTSDALAWNISSDKALISLFDVKNFHGLFRCLYGINNHYPINGIVYNISLDKIFESKSSINNYQKEIQSEIFELRNYLDKIAKKYNIKIPIYITFSGIEIISGFDEYMSVASNKVKYNPLGITLSASKPANFMKIKEKFQKFFAALNDNIIVKCDSTLSAEKVLKIITFTKQVILSLESIEPSLDRLFDNKIQNTTVVRGLYFISYKNSDSCFDLMRMQKFDKSGSFTDQRIYFLDNFFKDVILMEAYNFGENRNYIKKLKYKDYSRSGIAVVAGFVLSVLWIKSSLSYIDFFNKVDSKYNKILHSNVNPNNAAISFANLINQHSNLSLNGLYYSESLVDDLSGIYRNIIQINFIPQLEKDIANKLQQAIDNLPKEKVPTSMQVENLHTWLAVYLMLADEKHFDETMFVRNIKSIWSEQKISAIEFSNREELLDATIISGIPKNIKLNKALIFKAREILRSDSTYVLAYQMLKDQVLQDTDDQYTLLGEVSDVDTNYVFDNNVVKVSNFYTKKGYYSIYLKNQVDFLKKAAQSMWVLSGDEGGLSNLALVNLKANMDILYWNDYLNTWSDALDKINIQNTDSIKDLIRVLNSLTISDNPIVTVLKRIVANTDFISMSDVTNKVGLNSGNRNIVTSKYNEVIKLLSEYKKSNINKGDENDSKASGAIPEMSDNIGKIRNALVSISLSSQPNRDAFTLVQNKKESGIFKDLSNLWEVANNSPEPLKKWGSQIVNVITRVLNSMAIKEINARWEKEPLNYFNNYLKDRYPLKLNAYKQSSTKSFIEFFKKDGVMQKFIKENLASLIEKSSNSRGYVWKKYYGEPFAYDEDFLAMINSLNTIEEMFFSEEGIGFKIFLVPDYLNKSLSLLSIDFNNKSYIYANGPQEDFIIEWPAKNINKSPVTISYTSKDGDSNMINFDGEWGLFKFLEKGNIKYSEEKGVNRFRIYNDKNILAEYTLKTNSLDDKFSFDVFKNLNVMDRIKSSKEVNK